MVLGKVVARRLGCGRRRGGKLTRPMYSVNCMLIHGVGQTHPISLSVEERSRLLEHLCVHLLLAHTLCEIRGVGVHLHSLISQTFYSCLGISNFCAYHVVDVLAIL
jgi:hypothetical protein